MNKKIILSALLIRLFASSLLFHPDLKSQHFHAQFISSGVTNIYEYIAVSKSTLPYTDTFNYPPLTYFTLGAWQSIAKVFTGSGLTNWLNNWSETAIKNENIFSYLLFLKAPYFFIDLLILLILRKLTSNHNQEYLSKLWLFNPVSIYAVYAIGQFDIIPVLGTVAALWCVKENKFLLAGVSLGLAAEFKMYPIAILPFYFLDKPTISNASKIFIGFISAFVLPMLPYINSAAFKSSVLSGSLGARLFETQLFHIPVFIIFYLIFIMYCIYKKYKGTPLDITYSIATVLLSMLAFIRFHPQWLLWVVPFNCLLIAKKPRLFALHLLLPISAAFSILTINDQFIVSGLFSAINNFFVTIPPLPSLMPHLALVQKIASFGFISSVTVFMISAYETNKK